MTLVINTLNSSTVAMRKAILMMLLAVVSSSAMATWVNVSESEASTGYVDSVTISRVGDRVKMWELFDYKASRDIAGKPYMSRKAQVEYDCKDKQSRTLTSFAHSGNMGGGEVVYTELVTEKWEPVPPRNVVETLWKLACRKASE